MIHTTGHQHSSLGFTRIGNCLSRLFAAKREVVHPSWAISLCRNDRAARSDFVLLYQRAMSVQLLDRPEDFR
jgi:hypothetical protein